MRPILRVATAVALLAGVPPAARAAAGPEGARLLEASPAGSRIEVAFPAARLVRIGAEGASPGVRVDIDGCATSEVPGEPALPVRTVAVAVPPNGAVRVSGVTLGGTVRDGVDVPRTPWLDDGLGHAPPAPAEYVAARLIDVSWMRQQRIARIEVRPVRYDVAARRLTTFDRIDVAVDVDAAPASASAAPPDSDAFEPVYRRLLVNYEQGRAWRSPRGAAGAAARATGATTPAGARRALTVPDSSMFIGRRWVKIAVRETGFYRLPFSQFKSYAPFNNDTTIVTDSLRLITWSGVPILPEASYCDSCDYHEVALGIVDDDGRMNHTGDAIYFYALGPSDWADRFDSSLPDTVFLNHPYEKRNFYYLGVSTAALPLPGPRRRISTRNAAPSGGATTTPATFPWRVHQEQDNQYDPNQYPMGSSYRWEKFFWSVVPEGNTFTASSNAAGADTTLPVRVRVRLWSQFVECSSCPVCPDQRQFVNMIWNGSSATYGWFGYNGYTIDRTAGNFRRSNNSLQITMSDLRCNNEIIVHWFDVFYQRKFQPANDRLDFRAPAGGGTSLYRVGPFAKPSQPRLFDVSDPIAPVEITGAAYAGVTGGYELSFESTDLDRSRYATFQDTDFGVLPGTDVTAASGSSVDDLRSPTQEADYVLLYFDDFRQAADSLTAWRRAYNGFRTKSVAISAIYDQFSGGRTDPTAIRNFLRAAFQNWRAPQPAYVTFLGDASYDFKDVLLRAMPGQPGSPLPTYENSFESLLTRRQYTTDDWLLNVDDPVAVLPDFLGGRLPVISAAGALDVVRNKVIAYERSGHFGTHRNRVMLIADDSDQGSTADPLQWTHLQQTHTLDSLFTPNSFDRDYVYLHTFPTTTSFTKPIARDSIVRGISDEGVTVTNYIGHGSPFQLADEIVLVASDADVMRNGERLPLFIAASCDVGRFSDPRNSSLGEHLINNPQGGAIGVISSTDLAFAGLNAQLNRTIFRTLFARPGGGELAGEVAKALFVAKVEAAQTTTGSINAQKYTLLGDAALDLDLPRYWVDIDVKDDQGIDTTAIQQGRRMRFTGQVLSAPNGTLVPLDGTADLLVEDAQPLLVAPACTHYTCAQPNYLYRAGQVYRGSAAVQDGLLSGEFMVPLEAAPGKRGRIRVYLSGLAGSVGADAVGDLPVRVASGTAPAGDVTGPVIRLTFPNGASRVAPDAVLRIDLSDSSGILLTGHTPQNGIVVTVDDNTTNREEVTNSFRYNPGSYQSGSALFQLPQPPDRSPLREGLHVISVSAADNLAAGLQAGQHRSHATIQFEVVQQPPLKVLDAYLFPNPTSSTSGSSGGRFVVDTEGGRVDLQLRLYTVSGRLIRRLEMNGVDGQVQVPWDGLDAEGQGLSNGTYLFKVVVRSADSGDSGDPALTADLLGKFVIINP